MKYERVDIRSVDDLPKEEGRYQCHEKNTSQDYLDSYYFTTEYNDEHVDLWMVSIDWYLRPLSEEDYFREELIKAFHWYSTEMILDDLDNDELADLYLKTRKP